MTSHENITNTTAQGADDSLDALAALHTQSVDSMRGFEKMAEKAVPAFRPTVQRFHALHTRHVSRLDQMVREMGAVPDSAGSFMGTVNRAVVTMRAVFDKVDADTMEQIRSGEEYVLADFDRALAASLPQAHRAALTEMRAEIQALLTSSNMST